jgi:hypothetical protein
MPAAQGPVHVRTPRRTTRRTTRQPPSGIFGPVRRADAGITRAQHVAAHRTQRARRKVERRVVVPYVPKLAHPTAGQRGAAQSIVARGLRRQGITTAQQVRDLPKGQRRRVERAIGYGKTARRNVDVQRARQQAPTLAEQARALALASLAARSPAALSRALGLRGIQAYTDSRDPFAALRRRAGTVGARGLERALYGGPRTQLAAQGRALDARTRAQVLPGHHSRLQLAGVGPSLDLTSLGHTLMSATSLGRGDAGPRDLFGKVKSDAAALGTAPFIGGYEALAATWEGLKKNPLLAAVPIAGLPLAAASTERGQRLAKGVAEGYKQSVPGELLQGNVAGAKKSASEHPLLAALDLAAAAGAVGRTAGAVARGVGSTTEAAGLRGAAARVGSTVRPPLALNEDGGMALTHRSYSKSLERKGLQVLSDRGREPLRDAKGHIVYVTDRGRRVPVLKAHPGERELLNARRVDHFASGSNALERLSREESQRDVHVIHRGGRVKGRLGRNAREVVTMAAEKEIRPGLWREDIDKRIAVLERALEDPKAHGYRHTGEVKKAQAKLKALRKARDASPEQQAKVFAAADHLIALRKGQQAEEFRLRTLDPAEARRAELGPYAVAHMDARHFTAEEHARMEKAAAGRERSARAAVDAAPAGSAERAQALADYRAAREQRIAVSGRDPRGVHRHEDLHRQTRRAEAAHERAKARVRRLERERDRLTGRQQVQRGPDAARKMEATAGQPTRARKVLAHIDEAMGRDERRLRTGADKEQLRARVAAQLDKKLKVAREQEKATGKAAREARAQAAASKLPETQAALRRSDGTFLSNQDIEAHMRAHGVDPEAVAHLSHRELGKGAFHKRLDVNTRPKPGGKRRTYHAFERGTSGHGHVQAEETVVNSATRIAKAQSVDTFIHDHGLLHPDGRGWTGHEAAEAIDRLGQDTGRGYVAVRMYPASQDRAAIDAIQKMQSPRQFDELASKLLNDRIVDPKAGRARNIALVDAAQMNRMVAHLAPAGHIERLAQMLNRPFRFSVLAQPKWLTGNFVEPYFVRLPTVGSGFANIYGLGLDIAASRKIIRSMERSGDPRVRAEATRIKAQQHGGLFIGGRGASNRRKLADSDSRAMRVGAAVRELPVMKQVVDFLQVLPTAYFWFNRAAIERWAQEAAFGHQVRRDIHEFTGSWTQTVVLGRKALEDVQNGLVHTATQERFMRMQHELLGKYEGYSPTARRLIQTVAPFLPWALSAARFVYWTMPAHHTILTSVLLKTEQAVDKEWKDAHADVPASKFPGLQLDPRNAGGGLVPIARYTPYGLTGPITFGDLQGITNEFLPQLQGAVGALEGKDPFGNDLKVKPTASNPEGKASAADKVAIFLNSLLESTAGPLPRLLRTLREHGATPYSNSFLWSRKTKPGTAHGGSGANRAFNPFRPTYLRSGSSSAGVAPGNEWQQILAGSRGHVTVDPQVSEWQRILAGSRP